MEESIRMTGDRDKWRKYVHGVTNPRNHGRQKNKQSRMLQKSHAGMDDFVACDFVASGCVNIGIATGNV